MLMLLLHVEDECYALDSKRVFKVLPQVALKQLHHAPNYIAGLLHYRHRVIPVIDLRHFIQGTPCRSRFSTRIILVNVAKGDQPQSLLGLLAEQVTEVLEQDQIGFTEAEMPVNVAPYLGALITTAQGLVQCLQVEYLLPNQLASTLV